MIDQPPVPGGVSARPVKSPAGHVSPVPQKWKIEGSSSLLREQFGAENVFFNLESGCTHWVNALVVDLLDALIQGPADGRELARRLGLSPEEEEVGTKLEHILREMDLLGLISPVDL